MMLTKSMSSTLFIMQDNEIDVEGNMTTLGKFKLRQDHDKKDKIKLKDVLGSYELIKDSQDAKIEEMSRIIKILSNKLNIWGL